MTLKALLFMDSERFRVKHAAWDCSVDDDDDDHDDDERIPCPVCGEEAITGGLWTRMDHAM